MQMTSSAINSGPIKALAAFAQQVMELKAKLPLRDEQSPGSRVTFLEFRKPERSSVSS
jgi:hypothetical protein